MRKLLRRLRYLITQRRQQAALTEEMEFHRALKERELGAVTSDVVWMFLRRTVVQVGIGVAIGLAGAMALAQFLHSTPFAGPTEPA